MLRLALALQGALGFGEDDGDRSAQFVRGVGGEALLAFDRRGESVEGVVKHAAELVEFVVGAGELDAFVEVAGGDARGGAADGVDRLQGTPGEPPAATETGEPDGGAAEGEQQAEVPEFGLFGGDVAADDRTHAGRIDAVLFAARTHFDILGRAVAGLPRRC